MAASLSISIVTYTPPLNPPFDTVLEHLREAVQDARDKRLLDDVTITVVDNGQNRALLESGLEKLSGDLKTALISNSENVGYSAHNQGIKDATSDYHLILNPDVLLSRTSLSSGLTYLEDNQEAVSVCPYSEDEHGIPSYLCKRYPAVLDLALRGFGSRSFKQRFDARLSSYEYRDLPLKEPIHSVELISGCCMLTRTRALKECSGFDEKFFLYFEDFDLSLRMREYGNLSYCPDMQIIHYGGDAASKGFRHVMYFLKSAARFYSKHGLRLV